MKSLSCFYIKSYCYERGKNDWEGVCVCVCVKENLKKIQCRVRGKWCVAEQTGSVERGRFTIQLKHSYYI